ncbi:cytoplasmic FMR1-interacting protein-like [Mercenaria mercenaria]|uniref:cytoplasmic FMR1-interacting protein-like n=1 Tax=Mercenaria mercenaria TaxID=6596 RepID=UPI00234F4CF4|nr:cytoplasmic FMR1-interacting protein-like [Mercenaria mercenaria]
MENQEESCDIQHAAPFQNIIPKPYIHIKETDSREDAEEKLMSTMKALEQKYQSLHVLDVIDKLGNTTQSKNVHMGDILTRERLCVGLSMFDVILKRVQTFFDDPVWHGPTPANGAISVEDSIEFHRLWSAVQYVFCVPVRETEHTVEAMFGDSLNWAGCAIIVLLGQQKRFQALDFCYHILELNRLDKQEETVEGIHLKKMIDRIWKFKLLNSQIFDVLNKYLKSWTISGKQRIHCFEPPKFESQPNQDESHKLQNSM